MEEKRHSAAAVLTALGKALCYLLLFLGSQILVSTAFTLAAVIRQTMLGGGSEEEIMEQVMAYTPHISLASALLTLLVLAVFFLARKKRPLREVGVRRTRPVLVLASGALTPALYIVVVLVLALLPEQWMDAYNDASASLSQTGLLPLLSTVVAAPLVEEIIFRGLILSRLSRAIPSRLAVVVSAMLFGLCHGQIIWIAYAFALGLVFGRMAQRSGSILPSLLAHFIFNLIGYCASLLGEEFNPLILLGGLLALSVVGCLLTRRGVGLLLRRAEQPEVS